jgi:hypothetical protein
MEHRSEDQQVWLVTFRRYVLNHPLKTFLLHTLCVPGMGNWYQRYHTFSEGASLRQLMDKLLSGAIHAVQGD